MKTIVQHTAWILAVFGLLTASTVAQTQTDLPAGDKVMAKHIEAIGGTAAFEKIENRVLSSTIEIVNAGVTLNVTIHSAKPNKTSTIIQADAIGVIRKGCNGEVVWALSDMQGPVLERGEALENQLRDSHMDRLVYWKKSYQSAKCVGVEKVNDRDSYKVVLTPKPFNDPALSDAKLTPLTVFIDKSNFLANKIESKVVTDAGEIQVEAFFSDYRTVDGIKLAYKTELSLVGQKRILTIKDVKHNVDLPADQFDLPPEIQKLHKKNVAGRSNK